MSVTPEVIPETAKEVLGTSVPMAIAASEASLGNEDLALRTSSSAIAAQTVAQVQSRYVMAMKRPRKMDLVVESLMRECESPGFAEIARYKKPIGTGIEGLSIRFAEAALREYGNILIQDMVIHDDDERRIVKVAITDLERNWYGDHDCTVRKTVERKFVKDGQRLISSRTNSNGDTVHLVEATEDEIEQKLGIYISKAIRVLTMRMLPSWLKEQCEQRIIETVEKQAKAAPDETRTKLIAAFEKIGITAPMLESYLQHPILESGSLSPKETGDLRAIWASLKDGNLTWAEVLASKPGAEPEPVPEGKSATAEKIKSEVRQQKTGTKE